MVNFSIIYLVPRSPMGSCCLPAEELKRAAFLLLRHIWHCNTQGLPAFIITNKCCALLISFDIKATHFHHRIRRGGEAVIFCGTFQSRSSLIVFPPVRWCVALCYPDFPPRRGGTIDRFAEIILKNVLILLTQKYLRCAKSETGIVIVVITINFRILLQYFFYFLFQNSFSNTVNNINFMQVITNCFFEEIFTVI